MSIHNPFHPIAFEDPINAEKIRRLEDLIKTAFGDLATDINKQVVFVTPTPGTGTGGGVGGAGSCCAVVDNIAGLRALDATSLKDGARVWVISKGAAYALNALAFAPTDDGRLCVKANNGHPYGFYDRQLEHIQQNHVFATGYDTTTGIGGYYWDPSNVSGIASDENLGTQAGFPLATAKEVWERLAQGNFTKDEFVTVHLMSDVTDDDDSNMDVVHFFANLVQVIGDEIAIEGAETITLTAASDLSASVDLGKLTTAAFDFRTFISDNSRTVWARRANSSGGGITYAPLIREGYASNFEVFIGKQITWFPAVTGTQPSASQPFAPGDVISLVRFPQIGKVASPFGVALSRVDMMATYPQESPLFLYCVGATQRVTMFARSFLSGVGVQLTGGLTLHAGMGSASLVAFNVGSSAVTTNDITTNTDVNLATGSFENAQLFGGTADIDIGTVLFRDITTAITAAKSRIRATNGIGRLNVTRYANLFNGAKVYGFSNFVNAATTLWMLDGVDYNNVRGPLRALATDTEVIG